jgi:hypothetical protein
MLSTLGSADTCNSGVIVLDPTNLKPCLPCHIVFHIVVTYTMKYFTQNIFHTVVDEGALTSMMSLACWKSIGQPIFSLLPTLLM